MIEKSIASDVPEYPKIETLYDRDPITFKVLTDTIRRPEFEAVKSWTVTEKIDGTNVRTALFPDGSVFYGGRTADAQMAPWLLDYMRRTFAVEKLVEQFGESRTSLVVMYGEAYGPKIQKGGGMYRSDVAVRLFDVNIGGIWLEPGKTLEIAEGLGVASAPILGENFTLEQAAELVKGRSTVAAIEGGTNHPQEGIVCRSSPLMLNRFGHRVMWKLKAKDLN